MEQKVARLRSNGIDANAVLALIGLALAVIATVLLAQFLTQPGSQSSQWRFICATARLRGDSAVASSAQCVEDGTSTHAAYAVWGVAMIASGLLIALARRRQLRPRSV